MNLFWVILSIAALTVLLILLISYICFRMVFFDPKNSSPCQKLDMVLYMSLIMTYILIQS